MKKHYVLLGSILLVAALLRLFNLTAISLWHDEAFSALLVNYSWQEMFYRIGLDVHPPFYYVILRLWSDVFGHSLFALRGFSVFFGVATVWAGYGFMKVAFKKESLALATALLLAVNPFQIQYVTEARMYTLGSFLLLISGYFLVKAFDTKKFVYWLGFILSTSAAMYTHYYLFFSIFAIGLFALYYLFKNYRFELKKYSQLVFSYIIVLLLYIPWLKTFKFQFTQVQENYWILKMNEWSVPLTNWRMIFGTGADSNNPITKVFLVIASLFTIFLVYRVIKKEKSIYKWLALLGTIVPFLGALLLSLKQSIYLDRYFLFAALFYTILLCLFIFELPNKKLKYGIYILMVGISLLNWWGFWSSMDIKHKAGMASVASYLNNNIEEGDRLLIGSSSEFFNFKFYNRSTTSPLLYIPGISEVKQLPHFSGTALLTNAELIHDLNKGVEKGSTVWILWTNAFGGVKPEVPQNWVQIGQAHSWEDVRPFAGTWIMVDEYLVK
ncbi:MAG: glycosyltransferase family 39 protein [Patescibacteria group bacterium]